jgi:cell wall-associated NlpC family hydrolase
MALIAMPSLARAQRHESLPSYRVLALLPARPFEAFSQSALTMRDSVVALARAQIGKRYRTGGTSPDQGFDCSGLVKYILGAFQVRVPRTSSEQSRVGSAIPRDPAQLRPGDLLLFGRPKDGVSHVGIYVGNGRFIHASSVAGRVIESRLDRAPSPLIKALKSARRVVSDERVTLVALRLQ